MQKAYKIGMIGLGSIGKRHLSNVVEILTDRGIIYTIDLIRRKNSGPVPAPYCDWVSSVYLEEEDLPDDYDVLFVTNPTHMHFDTIKKYSMKAKHMFIEKPVFDDPGVKISDLSLNEDGIYYVACPLRYTRVLQYIKNQIDLESVYSARVISSSYLPDWRPGVDYRDTYSAHLDQGGGVSIDLIHEWDYVTYLFGLPKKIYNLRGKYSHLEIDSDDLSVSIAAYNNMLAEIHLDYFGRKPIRELQLFTREETIVADLVNSEIRFMKTGKVIPFQEERNMYQKREMEHFFDVLEGRRINENDLFTALSTLKIAKEGTV